MKLSLAGVEIWREGQCRLGPLELSLDVSGIIAVLGHNGAGKSLFLRVCHGMFEPEKGEVTWDGSLARQTRQLRGFVFQTTPVLRRSVTQNIEFPLLAQGVAKADRHNRVAEALELAGLTAMADQPAATLSGGEKQRMALVRALVTRPRILMMDEPSANLDPAANARLEEIVSRSCEDGTMAGLISTHDLGQARRMADHILLFDAGKLVFSGSKHEFFGETGHQTVENFKSGRI